MKFGNSPAATWLSRRNLALAGLLVFTLVVRGSVLWAMRDNLNQDPDAYREIAEFLLERGEFALGKLSPLEGWSKPISTAYRPPLYPIVLSNLPTSDRRQVSLVKVAALHLVLGVATVWLTWLTAARYFVCDAGPEGRQEIAPTAEDGAGPPGLSENKQGATDTPTLRSGLLPIGPPGLWIAPLIAGLLVACDPILLNQQTLVMTETLAAFLAILSLWCLARFDQSRTGFNAAMAGGTIGLAILCRPTFLPWLGLVGLTMLFVRARKPEAGRQKSEKRWLNDFGWRLGNFAGLCVCAAAITSPWIIRNCLAIGRPIIATTHGGYTLYLGNNTSFYDWLERDQSGLPWDARAFQARLWNQWATHPGWFRRNELEFDDFCYQRAKQAMRARPQAFWRACAFRACQLWSPLPHKLTADESAARRGLRYATAAWYCGVYTLAAIGIWRLRWALIQPPWIWGVLLCLAFTAVHTFYWTNLRMRAPLMPFIAIVAAAAVAPKFSISEP